MYTRAATEIVDIYETSIVFKGADPFAKKLDSEGKLIKPDFQYAVQLAKFSRLDQETEQVKDLYNQNKKFISHSSLDNEFILSLRNKLVDNNLNNKMDRTEKLLSFFGVANLGDIDDSLLAKFTKLDTGKEIVATEDLVKLKNDSTALVTLTGDLEAVKNEVTTLKSTIAGNEAFVIEGQKSIDAKRSEVERLYKLSVETPNEAVLETFKKADVAALEGFLGTYGKSATEKFTGTCLDCSSHNVSFRSSVDTTGNNGNSNAKGNVVPLAKRNLNYILDEFSRNTKK
jgi:hypothetical protein